MGKLSILKRRFFPSFYEHEAPKLIEFFKYYLEWMEQEDNPYWTIDNIYDFTDIDGSIDKYIEHLKYELMLDFPLEYAGDLRYIMKHLVMLYQSKGTINSLKFFFRALYNSFCEVSYPRENILKVSDGKWNQGYFVYSDDIPKEHINSLLGKSVIEVETGIIGLVNSVQPHYFTNESELKYCLVISDNNQPFTEGNTLRVYDTQETFVITKAEYSKGYWEGTDGFISSDKLLQDGYYYQNFSYVISSLVSIEEYRSIVEKLFHPAGMKMFGRVQLVESVEPVTKAPISFLRWWIVTMFMHVLAHEKELILHSIKIKSNARPYMFPWNIDQQYCYKQYGIIDSVKTLTPNNLYNDTNDSNRLVFTNGKLITTDWYSYQLPDNTSHYDIAGIYSECPVIRTYCDNGTIILESDNIVSDIVFIFVDGIKIRDSYITKTKTGYTIANNPSGNAVIYSLQNNIIKRTIKKTINSNKLALKNSKKECILPFINGEFVWDNIKYDNNEIALSQSTGYVEIYELLNNENLFVKHYYIENNNNNILYCYNQLAQKTLSTEVKCTYIDSLFNNISFKTYKFPYISDQQYYYKQYGTIGSLNATPNQLLSFCNESNKLVFVNEKLIIPNWYNYDLTTKTNEYVISGIIANKPHLQIKCNNGKILIQEYVFESSITDYSLDSIWIFVDGIKIPDKDVIKTEYGFNILTNISGNADIYFLNKNIIKQTISKAVYPEKINTIKFVNSNKQQILPFLNGKCIWDRIVYTVSHNIHIKYTDEELQNGEGYIEFYEFINNEELFINKYNIENNNSILYCHNPLKNIIQNI